MTEKQWTEEWQEGEPNIDEESIQWLKNRPKSVQKLMLRFPPSCLVRATRNLMCPARNEICIVTSYTEPNEKNLEGLVSVRGSPEATFKAQCRPEWLEVVGYYKGITPEVIKKILKKK